MQNKSNVIANRFLIQTKSVIGKGSFGSIYKAVDIITGKLVAVKFEKTKHSHCLLEYEYKILTELNGQTGFPQVYYFGEFGKFHVLVMDLLGENLETHFSKNERFNIFIIFNIFFRFIL